MEKRNPFMTVKSHKLPDIKMLYEITLSRANINDLLADCPECGFIRGDDERGVMICLFPATLGEFPKYFRPMPNTIHGGYYANIGWPVPTLPPHPTKKEFGRLAQWSYRNMENMLREHEGQRIPVKEETSLGKLTYGYVVMKIEKK